MFQPFVQTANNDLIPHYFLSDLLAKFPAACHSFPCLKTNALMTTVPFQ